MASAVSGFSPDIDLAVNSGDSGPEMRCLLDEPGTLSVCGEVDLFTAEKLRWCLHILAMDLSSTVAVDLTDVTFISCAGLAPLVEARRHLGQRLRLHSVSPAVRKLIRLTGLTAYFDLRALPGAARQ